MFFDLPDQEGEFRMEGGFSACQADPIDPSLERFKAIENVSERDRFELLWMKDERMVMAVGTAEVAVGKEENRADLP